MSARQGLTCSEQDPLSVYLELATVESTGIRIFTAGNIHTANATLSTILLGPKTTARRGERCTNG
jgi:hypothetical protein